MVIVVYICTHKLRRVALHALAANKYHYKNGGGSQKKKNFAVAFVVAFLYSVFLTSHLNPDQTRIIFKAALTQMTQTKCDLVDLGDQKWFQHWYGCPWYKFLKCTHCSVSFSQKSWEKLALGARTIYEFWHIYSSKIFSWLQIWSHNQYYI